MSSSASIGIMGGTYDPVHLGHLSIARSFLESGLVDELWVLLTPHPPHKERRALTSYEVRMEMLKAAFSGFPKVRVSNLESRLPDPSYTCQTLRHLARDHPDRQFLLCVGEDSFESFTSWSRWREIAENHTILVAERPRVRAREVPDALRESTRFISHEPVEISSTQIRQAVASGEDPSRWLPEEVLTIIRSRNLYRSDSHGEP